MAVTRTLFTKELRQHGPALLGLSALLAMAFSMGKSLMAREARVLSELEVLSSFALGPLVAAALYLGHRLVVAEHYGRTQRFVEALPVRRGHLALVKAAFGLAWLEAWALFALLGAAASAGTEPIGGRFLAILAARLGLYVFALWGVVFLLGFFGRLRVLLGGGLAVLALILDRTTAWHLHDFGPLALVGRTTFPLERHHFPTGAMLHAALVGAGAVALSWALSRVREGGIVEALARPLSRRELSALLVVGIGAIGALTAIDREPEPPPFAFATDRVLRDGTVEIGYLEDDLRPAAAALLARLAPTTRAFGQALGVSFPPVRVVHGPEVAVDLPQHIRNHPTEGVVLRVNLGAIAPGATSRVISQALHALVWNRTRGRAGNEERHWLLDGFCIHFADYGLEPPSHGAAPDLTQLRAVLATTLVPFDERLLREYERTAERLGDDVTDAVSASGWRLLEARVGRERMLALARATLTRPGTGDVRDWLHDRRQPVPRVFEETTGLAWPAFFEAWREELARLRAHPEARAMLAALPQGEIGVRATRPPAIVARLAAPVAADTTCTLRHRRLPPFDLPFIPDRLEETKLLWSAGSTSLDRAVDDDYGPGERAFLALDCDVPALGCWARLAAARVTVP